jgi:hypothetical protein
VGGVPDAPLSEGLLDRDEDSRTEDGRRFGGSAKDELPPSGPPLENPGRKDGLDGVDGLDPWLASGEDGEAPMEGMSPPLPVHAVGDEVVGGPGATDGTTGMGSLISGVATGGYGLSFFLERNRIFLVFEPKRMSKMSDILKTR